MSEVIVGHQYSRITNTGRPERYTVLEIFDDDTVKVRNQSSVEKVVPINVVRGMRDDTAIMEEEMKRMQEEMAAYEEQQAESGSSSGEK